MYTIADERRRARKPHQCQMCFRQIDVGETYRHQRNVDGGYIWTWKDCAHCEAAVRILDLWMWAGMPDDGFGPDSMGAFEPETIAQARIWLGWKTQWRRRDGTLREVPGNG
jgi:hypothetical protein